MLSFEQLLPNLLKRVEDELREIDTEIYSCVWDVTKDLLIYYKFFGCHWIGDEAQNW